MSSSLRWHEQKKKRKGKSSCHLLRRVSAGRGIVSGSRTHSATYFKHFHLLSLKTSQCFKIATSWRPCLLFEDKMRVKRHIFSTQTRPKSIFFSSRDKELHKSVHTLLSPSGETGLYSSLTLKIQQKTGFKQLIRWDEAAEEHCCLLSYTLIKDSSALGSFSPDYVTHPALNKHACFKDDVRTILLKMMIPEINSKTPFVQK